MLIIYDCTLIITVYLKCSTILIALLSYSEKDCDDSLGSKDLDNLALTDTFPNEEKKSLIAQKLSREASVQSSSSLDSILDSRRPDPVEVLLNLGFGGVPGVDMHNCRIPKRFLVPSKVKHAHFYIINFTVSAVLSFFIFQCKGGDWNEFLKRELLQAQNFECASLGFRGLSGINSNFSEITKNDKTFPTRRYTYR